MFQYRVESLFAHYILDSSNPIGKVKEYAIKIEFQERGSPHAHCLLWVDGAPRIDIDSDEDVCSFIDTYISGVVPDDSLDTKHMAKLVRQYETHSHSSYCRQNHSCCFGFSKAPSPHTIICREPDNNDDRDATVKGACEVLSKVYEIIDKMPEKLTLDDVLSRAGISKETYVKALKVTHHGRSVVLKRNPADAYTNGCNHDILQLWGANIDFQYVLDEYSTVMYVCSYMMKSEKAMGEVLKSVSKECHSEPIAEQLKKIGKAFVGHRVVGAPEAAMCELSMWFMKKSRKVTFVNSGMRDDHVSLPKNGKILDGLEDDEDNVYMLSIHDRYAARPDALENMCLAKFAVSYEPLYGSAQCDEMNIHTAEHIDDSGDEADGDDSCQRKHKAETITLKNNLGQMHKHKFESILCVTSFGQNAEPEKYYHSRLILYFPWCSEDELIDGYLSYSDHYNDHCN